MSRSGIVLKKGLPWLRDKFLDAEGCRTLHYYMAHRNLIQFDEASGKDLRTNEWIKFLQSYTVPPLMIKLSKDRSRSSEDIDCNKLIEELLNSGTVVREKDKELRELVENNCGEQYLKAVLKDTSAMDPEASKKAIHMKQLLTKNMNAIGDAFGLDLLSELYTNLLHKLDPQGLIALLLACLSSKLGVSLTAEALCEVAIEKLIESVGVEEMKKQLVEWVPQLAIFFPELQQIAVEQRLGMSGADLGIQEYGKQFFDSAASGQDLSDQFTEDLGDIENQEMFSRAPIAAAMTLAPNPVGDFYVYDSIAKMERMGRFIPLVPVWGASTVQHMESPGTEEVTVHHKQGETIYNESGKMLTIVVENAMGETTEVKIPVNGSYYLQTGEQTTTLKTVALAEEPTGPPPQVAASIEQIADQKTFYLEKGFSSHEADAAMVRDGIMMVQESFINNIKNPQSVNVLGGIDSTLDHLTKLDDKLSNLSPNPSDANHVSWGPFGNTNQNMAATANAAEQAKQFVQYLKQVINLQELCEKIVGPLLQAPGLLFSDPDDFVRNWENWADGLKDSLVRQFQFPELNIPTLRMPDNLSTDDLVGTYAKMLLQVLAAMIGMILGQILNLILLELLETCFEEPEGDETKPIGAPSPSGTIPLPVIGQIASELPNDAESPDFAAWIRDITAYLSPDQLCALLMSEATENTINIVLGRTEGMWPDVWAAGMDNSADIQTIFSDLGQRLEASGGLEICNAIRATTPILVDFCETDYDYDGRCAELQLQGLTKKECDEVIKQEIEDLRNKIMGLSSMLFPGENILQGSMPEPCGPNGYFTLPFVMEDTMSRVTDNILQAVKTALIGDMASLKFFSMPPRSLLAQTDPEVMEQTYNTVMDVMEEKYEIDCVMPICHNPMEIFADAIEKYDSWDDIINWGPKGLAEKGFIPLVYSSRGARRLESLTRNINVSGEVVNTPELGQTAMESTMLSVFEEITDAGGFGYSKADSLLHGKEVYKGVPDPTLVATKEQQRSAFTNDHATRMYTIGDLFNSAGLAEHTLNYASHLQLVGYVRQDVNEWEEKPGTWEHKLPSRFYKSFGQHRAGRISSLFFDFATSNPDVQDYIQKTQGPDASIDDIINTGDGSSDNNNSISSWEISSDLVQAMHHFENVSTIFSKYTAKQVIRPEDPLEKQNPIAHEYVLSASEYMRARGLKARKVADHKYVLPFKLDQPLIDLMPLFGYTTSTGGKDAGKSGLKFAMSSIKSSIEKYVEDGKNSFTAMMYDDGYRTGVKIASFAYAELLASYIGVSSATLSPNLLLADPAGENAEQLDSYKVQELLDRSQTASGDIDYNYLSNLLISKNVAIQGISNLGIDAFMEILQYAPSVNSYFIDAFLRMPIGEAIGITKQNVRSLFPDWPGLYEAINESGVYFEMIPPERNINCTVTGMSDEGVGLDSSTWELLAERIYWFGGRQLRPVAVSFKNFFRDSNNTFENLSAEDVIPSLSKSPTSPKLINAFDDPSFHPVFPVALYKPVSLRSPGNQKNIQSYEHTLTGMSKFSKIPGVANSKDEYFWTNINPDVSYFPMPFRNPLAVPKAQEALSRIQGAMSNMGFEALGDASTITDGIKLANIDKTLMYQEYTLNSFYDSRKGDNSHYQQTKNNPEYAHPGSKFRILDDYKICKSKFLSDQAMKSSFKIGQTSPRHDPTSPVKQNQLKDSEFDFEFIEEYDDDIYNILNSLGLSDVKDLALEAHSLSSSANVLGADQLSANGTGAVFKRTLSDNMKKIDTNNFKSIIFSKFIFSKLLHLSDQYAATPIEENSHVADALKYMFATTEYSSCKFAYISKVFGKLRLSRLNERKYMKKLWSKVLKTPIDSQGAPQCRQFIDKLATKTQEDLSKTETDFFNIDSIKPNIMEFYKNSVCRDVYESSEDQYTASQRALIEASLILLVRVYSLELCFAGLVSWDAYDLSDIFKEPIIKRILIKNMQSEIKNFDLIIEFANDYVKKKENIKSVKALLMKSGQSGLEYIIEQEAENINNTIAKMFNNSKQISTKMQLNTTLSTDDDLQKQLEKVIFNGRAALNAPVIPPAPEIASEIKAASQVHDAPYYPAVNFLSDNIYTHNYSSGMVENRYFYNKPFGPGESVMLHPATGHTTLADNDRYIGKSWPDGTDQDFGGLTSDLTQKNFLHSVPLNYYSPAVVMDQEAGALLTDGALATEIIEFKGQIYSGDYGADRPDGPDPAGKPDALYEYLRHYIDMYGTETLLDESWSFDAPTNGEDVSYSVFNSVITVDEKIKRILASKLLCDPSQMVNQHEYLAGNLVNSKLGNFIIQPYVKIVDQSDRSGFKSRSSLGDAVDPCDIDDETQGNIAEATTELGAGPILSTVRSENNPFKAWIYGVVPLSVFNWFMKDSFVPWINAPANEKIKLLYNDHGIKPFFEELKFGMRLVYVSQFGPLHMSDTVRIKPGNKWVSVERDLKDHFGLDGLKNAKAGLVSRTYFLEDEQKEEGWLFARKDGKKTGPENTPEVEGGNKAWRIPLLFNELHIPIAEVEKDIIINSGGVSVAGIDRNFDDFCYTKDVQFFQGDVFGSDPAEAFIKAKSFSVREFFKEENKDMYKSLVQTPSNFYFKHVAANLLEELQQTPEFRLMFDHLLPIRRYMALGFLYSSDALLEFIGEPTDVLDGTKSMILNIMENLLESSDNYSFIPPAVRNQMADDISASLRGTNIKEPGLHKKIMEIIWKCMLMILKGFVELTDPAVIIAKSILDVAKLVYDTIIIGIETGLQVTKQILQQTIDTARSSMMQLEVSLAVMGPSAQITLDTLRQAAEKAIQDGTSPAAADFNTGGASIKEWSIEDGDVSKWLVDVDISYSPDESLVAPWEAFKSSAISIQESLAALQAASTALDEAQLEMDTEIAEFEEEYEKVKKEMDDIFGSSWLLPATWASLVPSMIPFGGGIVPPPFFVGPPSTIPGMIYLALLLADVYEEEQAAALEESKDPNCEDEL